MVHVARRNLLSITLDAETITHLIPYLSCTLQERHTPIADTQARGRRDAEGGGSVEGKKWGDGKIEVVLDPTTAPYWFALALGVIDSSTPKIHKITQNPENEPLVATICRDRNVGRPIKFENAVVNSMELSFADDVAKLSMDVLSKSPVEGKIEEKEIALTYYTFRNALVEIEGMGDPLKVRELTLRVENEAELIYAPNSNDVDRIIWKTLRVTGNFKLLFEDETQLAAFKDTTVKQKMTITFTGEGDEKIEIEIPQFRVDTWVEEASIDDLAQEGIDFVAEYDITDGIKKTISAEIVNGVDRYITES